MRIPLSLFWSGTSYNNFYKATENPNASLRRINIWIIVYLGDVLLMNQIIEGLNMARGTLIFLLQQLALIINLKNQYCL